MFARLLQGMGGAMMVPVGRLVLLRSVPKSELVRAMAWFTVPALIGPLVGPPLGGFITTYLHWRWIFWINVPIGILGVVLVTAFIPNSGRSGRRRSTCAGFLLAAGALVGLVFGFETLGRGPLPCWAAGPPGDGRVFAALYLRHARRTGFPVIDLDLLRVPTFRAAIIGGFLFRVGIGAMPFLLPLILQAGFGLSAFRSGLLTFAAALGRSP